MASTIKLKNGSGAPLAGDLVQGEPALDLTNKRLYTEDSGGTVIEVGTNPTSLTIGGTALTATAAELNTLDGITATTAELNTLDGITATVTELNYTDGVTSNIQTQLDSMVEKAGDSMTGDLSFGDNNKVVLGAGSDLQIYHDGSNSFIADSGTGSLVIRGSTAINLQNSAGTEYLARFFENGSTNLYYDAAKKFATTSTGIDVTGTVTSDGLVVQGESYFDTNNGARALHVTRYGTVESESANFTIDDNDLVINSVQDEQYGGYSFKATHSGTGTRNRLDIANNGDISFYEDTGTTAKFFWDASAERLGIGTSSPSNALTVSTSTSYGQLRLQSNNTTDTIQYMGLSFRQYDNTEEGYAGILGYTDNDENRIAIGGSTGLLNSATTIQFFTGANNTTATGTEAVRIDSSGNVGIGTTSPTFMLDVAGNARAAYFAIRSNETAPAESSFIYRPSTGVLGFGTGTAERMRIDSSGHLLFGKTSPDPTSEGFEVRSNGLTVVTRDSDYVGIFNRNTNDGDIVHFRKDNSTVGSIGSLSGTAYIAGSSKGLRFGSAGLIPATTTGANSDANYDIGDPAVRFKDLYLSGGVYLGGTSAANLLDDYEEGTFTPTTAGDATGVLSTAQGYYTKTGRVVNIAIYFLVSTSFTDQTIGGLPFTVAAGNSATSIDTPASVLMNVSDSVVGTPVTATTTLNFYNDSNALDSHAPNTTNAGYRISLSYITS